MLLKHLNIVQLVLLTSFFYHVFTQVFSTGIIQLTSNTINSSFTLTNITSNKDVILTISSFTSIKKLTVCSIVKRQENSINFICTQNIKSVSYLCYQKTPLIYSNTFDYYFLSNDQRTNVTWVAPINLTIIQYPTLKAMLSGFSLRDKNYASIQLLPLLNNTGITISRSVDVKRVSFSFIIIQNFGAYNLSIDQMLFSMYTKMSFQSQSSNVLNFWGFSSFKFQKIMEQNQIFLSVSSKGINSNSANLFHSSQNLLLSVIFLISNQNKTSQNCPNYYNPALKECVSTCNISNTIRCITNQFKFNFCLNNLQNNQKTSNYSNLAYLNNNSNQLLTLYSLQTGCNQPYLNQDDDLICKSCTGDFIDYKGSCVCKYGFIKEMLNCRKCQANQCQLKKQIIYKVKEINLTKINIQVSVYLDKNQLQLKDPKNYKQNLTINGKIEQVDIIYDSSSVNLNFEIHKITKQNNYQIRIHKGAAIDPQSLFYIRKTQENQTQEFLWSLALNLTIKSNLSSQAILKTTLSSLVQNSDKTIPFIFAIGFLIGDKINLMSFFQTISIVYLAKFINIEKEYDVLKDLISKIFIFHPKALFNFQNLDKILRGFVFQKQIKYNISIQMQTQGNMLLKNGLNQLISLLLQILGISLMFFLAKKIIKPSPNKVSPTNLQNQLSFKEQILRRQKCNQMQSKSKQLFTSKKDLRTRLFILLSLFDQKKQIHFTSLILTYNLYFILLSLYQMTLPLFSLQAIFSRIFTSLLLLFILVYPVFLINYKSQYLLKTTSILKKRYSYAKKEIWFYFYLYYNQSIMYGIILVLVNNPIAKVSIIICFQLAKLIYFRKMLKNIQILKIGAIALFYISLLLDLTLPLDYYILLNQISVVSILFVILCQLLKLVRGLIILTLSLLKGQQNKQKLKQKTKDKEEDKQNAKNTQKVVIIQKIELVNEEDINPILTNLTSRCQNRQKTIRYQTHRKRNQNMQINNQKDQSKKKQGLKRFNQIIARQRDVLKLQN